MEAFLYLLDLVLNLRIKPRRMLKRHVLVQLKEPIKENHV